MYVLVQSFWKPNHCIDLKMDASGTEVFSCFDTVAKNMSLQKKGINEWVDTKLMRKLMGVTNRGAIKVSD